MKILILAALVTHMLQGQITNDLVGIHIGRGTSATLNHVYHEMLMARASLYSLTCGDNGVVLIQWRRAYPAPANPV